MRSNENEKNRGTYGDSPLILHSLECLSGNPPDLSVGSVKYSIYQIDSRKDAERVRFESYDRTLRWAGKINPDIYKEVWSGETHREKPENIGDFLEELFFVFNTSSVRPSGYRGVSLSVSDIIVVDGSPYFIDSIGFKPIGLEGLS